MTNVFNVIQEKRLLNEKTCFYFWLLLFFLYKVKKEEMLFERERNFKKSLFLTKNFFIIRFKFFDLNWTAMFSSNSNWITISSSTSKFKEFFLLKTFFNFFFIEVNVIIWSCWKVILFLILLIFFAFDFLFLKIFKLVVDSSTSCN